VAKDNTVAIRDRWRQLDQRAGGARWLAEP